MKGFSIDKWGFWFPYKGEEVGYIWPWSEDRRKNLRKRFYSTSFCSYFKTLKEIDECWDGYNKAEEEAQKKWGSELFK